MLKKESNPVVLLIQTKYFCPFILHKDYKIKIIKTLSHVCYKETINLMYLHLKMGFLFSFDSLPV